MNRDAVMMASKGSRKDAELSAAASAAASDSPRADVIVDPEDDFEEFTPVSSDE